MGTLDDKVVLITGAASGIGEATAQLAAREGARLVLGDVNEAAGDSLAASLRDGGAQAIHQHTDVVDEDQAAALVTRAREEFGRLDGAFNNAGILGTLSTTGEFPYDAWKQTIAIDLNGVFVCTKHELRVMADQGFGSIVNMSSAAGLIGWPLAPAYVAAKHGVVGLTKAAALEYAAQGIRVNAICPSYVETPLVLKELFEDLLGGDQAAQDAARANHPIGRFAQPSEIAEAVVWMLSDKASFVTGSAMSVDGGYTAP